MSKNIYKEIRDKIAHLCIKNFNRFEVYEEWDYHYDSIDINLNSFAPEGIPNYGTRAPIDGYDFIYAYIKFFEPFGVVLIYVIDKKCNYIYFTSYQKTRISAYRDV